MSLFYILFIALIVITILWLYSAYKLILDKNVGLNKILYLFITVTLIREVIISLFLINDCTGEIYIKSLIASGCQCHILDNISWLTTILSGDFYCKILSIILIPAFFILSLWKKRFFIRLLYIALAYFSILIIYFIIYSIVFQLLDEIFVDNWNILNIYHCTNLFDPILN